MANPFRAIVDGQPSTVLTRPLELLLSSTGSIVEETGYSAEQDAKWAAHAEPLLSSTLFVNNQQLPVQLDWNRFSTSLVFTLGAAGDQVRYLIGQHRLFEAIRDEQRLTRARRAALEVSVSVQAEQVDEFRQLIDDLSEADDEEPMTSRQAAFYDEHPDLTPEPGSQVGIRSESVHEALTVFTLWVSDAQIANALGRIWQQREQAWEQAQPAGSPTALRRELDEVLRDIEGYGWSLVRLTMMGENWLGKPVEADEAQEALVFLQLQLKAAEARRVLISTRLAEQEGGQQND